MKLKQWNGNASCTQTGSDADTSAAGGRWNTAEGAAETDAYAVEEKGDWIRKDMKQHLVHGAAVGLIRNGELTCEKYYGEAGPVGDTGAAGTSGEANRRICAATHFEAASLTKAVFSWYILQLVQNGDFDLDRPLLSCLQESGKGACVQVPTDDPAFRAVTARQILSHASGLPDWGDAPLPLSFTPGKGFLYSGKAYTFLQEVIETIRGARIDVLLQEEVFLPLGMKNAAMLWTAPLNRTLSRTYDENGRIEEPRHTCRRTVAIEPNAAFSLYVTLEDYAAFLQHLLGDRESLELIRSVSNPAAEGVSWGLGWGRCREVLWHWGDNGGFKAFVIVDPETKDGILIFTNSCNGLEFCMDLIERESGFGMEDIRRMIDGAEPQ